MRVINRVHRHTANGRTNTTPAVGTSFTQLTQHVLGVTHFTDGGAALGQNFTYFTGTQTQSYIVTFTGQDLDENVPAERAI